MTSKLNKEQLVKVYNSVWSGGELYSETQLRIHINANVDSEMITPEQNETLKNKIRSV